MDRIKRFNARCKYAKTHPIPSQPRIAVDPKTIRSILANERVSIEMTRWALFVHFGFCWHDDCDIAEVFALLPSCQHDVSDQTYGEIISAMSDQWTDLDTGYQIRAMRAAGQVLIESKHESIEKLWKLISDNIAWYEGRPE